MSACRPISVSIQLTFLKKFHRILLPLKATSFAYLQLPTNANNNMVYMSASVTERHTQHLITGPDLMCGASP
jgi:hypothetical protein